MKSRSGKQSGFSLIEVIVSFAIFITMGAGMILVSQGAYRSWENARNKAVAYNLLQKYIELLRNVRDTSMNDNTPMSGWANTGIDLFNATPQNTWTDDVGGKVYNTHIDVVPVDVLVSGVSIGNELKRKATVTVSWTEKMGAKSLSADTYFTQWKGKY